VAYSKGVVLWYNTNTKLKSQIQEFREMKAKHSWRRLAPALLAGLLMVGCSDDDETAQGAAPSAGSDKSSSLLAHVPDATPYVAANTHRMSDEMMDQMWKMSEPAFAQMDKMIEKAIVEINAKTEKNDKDRLGEAIVTELQGHMSRAGLAELGLEPTGNFAFYGLGMLPVLRAEVVDAAKLQATVDRIEQKAGQSFPKQSFGGVDYYEGHDKEGVFIAAIHDNQLILSMLPSKLKDALLPQILGLEKPSESLADSGRLEATNEEFGLMSNGTMVLDNQRIVEAVFNQDSEVARELFGEGLNKLDATCEAEFRALAGVAPRVISGTTAFSDQAVDGFVLLELRPDLAQGLSAIKAAIPGLGQEEDGMFYFAAGLNLINARQFVADRVAAIVAEPYQCAELADLNTRATEAQLQIGQPLPPFVSNLRGVRVNAREIKMDGDMESAFSGLAMVAMENPQLMLGMGQAFVPELAELQLTMDGQPVALPAGLSPVPLEEPHVAMVENGIGFSIGQGQSADLQAFMTADPPAEPPFISLGYDMQAIMAYQFAIMQQMLPDDADLVAEPAGLNSIDRISATVDLTSRGVEVSSHTTLKP
jgi:hypothetical protein